SAEKPGGLCAAGAVRRRSGVDAGAEPCDRDRAGGTGRGLRPGRPLRRARDGGYDGVVAFGGDGTLNEVVNGVAGTEMPVAILPGGSTNVVARTLGMPNDVVDATEHLLSLADDWQPRKIDLGMVDDRYFVFACGAGIDASVVKRVDRNPTLKGNAGPYYYSWAGVSSFYRKYLLNPVRVRTTV